MAELDLVAVSFRGVSLSLKDWLAHFQRRGWLMPLLREALIEHFLIDQSRQAGLSVSTEEIQQAANAFRQRNGLASAEQTRAWLDRQRLAITDLEEALERNLLIDKLEDKLTGGQIAAHFEAHQAGYARARLRLILVQREDVARELLSQVRDEGRDFCALAREHSQHPSRSEGGRLAVVLRRDLPPATADAIFAAQPGALLGPLATPQGFSLFLVEGLLPATLDADLTSRIRQELFDDWLRKQLSSGELQFPLLERMRDEGGGG